MDKLRAIGVFVAVADAGSLSGAARQLGEPLTNVSRLLVQLEEELGFTLVERSTRRIALTSAGHSYLKTCRTLLDDLHSTEASIAGLASELSGDISITAPVGLGRLHVVPVVTEFLSKYPRLNVRLMLVDRIVDLSSEEIDVAVRVGRMKDSELVATRVGTLKLVTCASPDYLGRRGNPQSIEALSKHDCITFSEWPGGARWVFNSRRYGRKASRVRSRLNVNTADAVINAATAGIGVARVLSYQARAAIEGKLLEPILQRFEDTAIPVHLVSRRSRLENSRVREFMDFASERLRFQLRD